MLGVFHRIAQQVQENLVQAIAVARYDGRDVSGERHGDVDPLGARQAPRNIYGALGQGVEIEVGLLNGETVRLEA